MQYQITEHVPEQAWEQDQAGVLEQLRRRVQHDLDAQNPGSVVTIEAVQPHVRASTAQRGATSGAGSYVVDVIVEYRVSGQPNPLAS